MLNPEDGIEICVISKDPTDELKAKLLEVPVAGVTKVLAVNKLKKKYHEYKMRRELVAKYDAFFCDDRVITMMPQLCGKIFFERRKQPVPIRVDGKAAGAAKAIATARDSTFVFIGAGQTVNIRVGISNMTAEQVAANIMAAIGPTVDNIPKKWKNVGSIYLQATGTVALPVYKSLPSLTIIDDDADMEDENDAQIEDDDASDAESDEETEEEGQKATKPAPAKGKKGAAAAAAAGSAASSTAAAAAPTTGKKRAREAETAAPAATKPAAAASKEIAAAGGAKKSKGADGAAAAVVAVAPSAAPKQAKVPAAKAAQPAAAPAVSTEKKQKPAAEAAAPQQKASASAGVGAKRTGKAEGVGKKKV